ncbi:MAG: 3'-5' exonuclease, partial [Candidatus Poribacteria bacterium]|nr:3'-5' exonuclease [Candidatus Poribacteria bacterium]
FIVYDLATVGNNPKWAEIIEVGATKLDQMGNASESRHQLVKPTGWIPPTSVISYNISNQMVANKPPIAEVLPNFINFIDNQVLVGHNIANFDNEIIRRDMVKYLNREFQNTAYCDIMAVAQRLYPRQNPSFEALAEKFNIIGEDARSTGIVDTTLKIFRQLVNEDAKRRELTSLSEFLPLVGLAILYRSETAPKYNQILYQASLRYLRNNQIQPHRDFLDCLTGISKVEKLINQLRENVGNFKESSLDFRKSQDVDWEERTLDFMKDLSNFEQNFDAEEIGISDFLKYFNLINREPEVDKDELTLMTIHAAKGMEYRAVIIMGMEDGVFPIRYRDQTRQEIEEDRRLFYVGMTRAKERLYFTTVRQRQENRVQASSMFIDEIPKDLLKSWASK